MRIAPARPKLKGSLGSDDEADDEAQASEPSSSDVELHELTAKQLNAEVSNQKNSKNNQTNRVEKRPIPVQNHKTGIAASTKDAAINNPPNGGKVGKHAKKILDEVSVDRL